MADTNENEQNNAKDFGFRDFLQLISDALQGDEGVLPNLAFMPPQDPGKYDALAWQSARNMREIFESNFKEIAGESMRRRSASLAATTGIGETGMRILNSVSSFSPSIGTALLGHFGGSDAVKRILSFGNGIAVSRGAPVGGVMNPVQLGYNMRFAATQGGLAYANNFNQDGSINVDQTRGLGLATTGYIIGGALADRSQYQAFEKRMGGGRSILNPTDVNNFVNGVGATEDVQRAFNEQIRKFTKGINSLVASVAKMTGSSDEAIRFLMDATGGELFRAGAKADKARADAGRLATNIRIAAADAGIKPERAYGIASQYTANAAVSAGMDQRAIFYGATGAFTKTGALGAVALSKWQQENPGATDVEKERAAFAIQETINHYEASSMSKINAFAATLADKGVIDLEEYKGIVRTGSGRAAKQYIEDKVGRDALTRFLYNPANAELAKYDHKDTYQAIAMESITQARSKEALRVGRDRMFRNATEDAISLFAKGDYETRRQLSNKAYEARRDNMLSDEALEKAGVSKELRESFRKNMLDKGYTPKQIAAELSERKYNAEAAYDVAYKKTIDQLSAEFEKRTMTADEEKAAVDVLNGKTLKNGMQLRGSTIKEIRQNLFKGGMDNDDINREIREILKTSKGEEFSRKAFRSDREGATAIFQREAGKLLVNVTDESRREAEKRVALEGWKRDYDNILSEAAGGSPEALRQITQLYAKDGKKTILGKAVLEGSSRSITTRGYENRLLTVGLGLDKIEGMTSDQRKSIDSGIEKSLESDNPEAAFLESLDKTKGLTNEQKKAALESFRASIDATTPRNAVRRRLRELNLPKQQREAIEASVDSILSTGIDTESVRNEISGVKGISPEQAKSVMDVVSYATKSDNPKETIRQELEKVKGLTQEQRATVESIIDSRVNAAQKDPSELGSVILREIQKVEGITPEQLESVKTSVIGSLDSSARKEEVVRAVGKSVDESTRNRALAAAKSAYNKALDEGASPEEAERRASQEAGKFSKDVRQGPISKELKERAFREFSSERAFNAVNDYVANSVASDNRILSPEGLKLTQDEIKKINDGTTDPAEIQQRMRSAYRAKIEKDERLGRDQKDKLLKAVDRVVPEFSLPEGTSLSVDRVRDIEKASSEVQGKINKALGDIGRNLYKSAPTQEDIKRVKSSKNGSEQIESVAREIEQAKNPDTEKIVGAAADPSAPLGNNLAQRNKYIISNVLKSAYAALSREYTSKAVEEIDLKDAKRQQKTFLSNDGFDLKSIIDKERSTRLKKVNELEKKFSDGELERIRELSVTKDEAELSKIFSGKGDETTSAIKELGMSPVELGKVLSAGSDINGTDQKSQDKRDDVRTEALVEQKIMGEWAEGGSEEVVYLQKIYNLLQKGGISIK